MKMIDIASRLHRELSHFTKDTLEQPVTFLKKTAMIISKANAIIKEINDHLRNHEFSDQETEINFFRNVLPPIHAHHHIYMDLHRLEVDKPILEKKAQEYYLKQVDTMDEFLEHNAAFYKYYREEATHHDYQYFTRTGSESEESFEWYVALIDRCCMTPHSLKIALLLAYQYIKNYINGILLKLKDNEGLREMPLIEQNNITTKRLHWTGTKVAAVELCYALFANKCLENGKAPIYQIVNHFEQSYGIELPFPHRTMQDVATRKAGPTVQLDDMKRDLIRLIDNVFLKPYAK